MPLGRFNWVTSTGGRHDLVPGLTTERGRRRDQPYVLFMDVILPYITSNLHKMPLWGRMPWHPTLT